METLKQIKKELPLRIPQNHEEFTYAPIMMNKRRRRSKLVKISKRNSKVNVNPWPSAYTTYEGSTMKVWKTELFK